MTENGTTTITGAITSYPKASYEYKVEYLAGTAISTVWVDAEYYELDDQERIARFFDKQGVAVFLVVNVLSITLTKTYPTLTIGDPPLNPPFIPNPIPGWPYSTTVWPTVTGPHWRNGNQYWVTNSENAHVYDVTICSYYY